jgi:gluconate 5-dehydrogenase
VFVGSGRFDLGGKTALVTGSSRGLGFTIARGLGEAGASLVLNGRDARNLEAAVSDLRGRGLRVEGRVFDVTDPDAVAAGVDEIERNVGTIDILVNNAGVHRRAPLVDMTPQQWREVIDTNLSSVFYVSQAVGRRMVAKGRGKIVVICSLMTELARPTVGNYSAAKGALRMLIRSMTAEWARHNVQINGIGPGYFRTDMTRTLYDDAAFNAWICSRTPAGRWGMPEDLVGAAVFLASDASNFVNGQIIYVDGGILATL